MRDSVSLITECICTKHVGTDIALSARQMMGQIFKIVYGYLDQGRARRTKNDDEVRLYARKCEESVDESYTL